MWGRRRGALEGVCYGALVSSCTLEGLQRAVGPEGLGDCRQRELNRMQRYVQQLCCLCGAGLADMSYVCAVCWQLRQFLTYCCEGLSDWPLCVYSDMVPVWVSVCAVAGVWVWVWAQGEPHRCLVPASRTRPHRVSCFVDMVLCVFHVQLMTAICITYLPARTEDSSSPTVCVLPQRVPRLLYEDGPFSCLCSFSCMQLQCCTPNICFMMSCFLTYFYFTVVEPQNQWLNL